MSLRCRNCGLLWPGDAAFTTDDLAKMHAEWLPICIKAPPADRWFKDSGINGHIFDLVDKTAQGRRVVTDHDLLVAIRRIVRGEVDR